MKQYYGYILASKSRALYTGVTNDLNKRLYEHKEKLVRGFTAKYKTERLVYFEAAESIESAISREKQIKGWLRSKKIALIESTKSNLGGFIRAVEIKKQILRPCGPQDDKVKKSFRLTAKKVLGK